MEEQQEGPRFSIRQLLKVMTDRGGSDLHVTTGTPPQIRIDGSLVPLRTPPLTAVETKALCYEVLSDEQKVRFERDNELDFSFNVKGISRFRANIFLQRGAVGAAFRAIPFKVRTLDELGVPPVLKELAHLPRGLVLVTGPTGSGKSTTLAAMIDEINSTERNHILTVEDPIEYLHPNKLSVVNQREIGADTESFKGALRYALRQDPDVVLVGEMRDLETIEAAMTISETGHLAFATLHTNSAVQSINRVIDVFPPHQQSQVRAQLSFVLQAVVTQMLVPRCDGPGRALALEVMIPNAGIRNLIREAKVHQIYGMMQTGQGISGMQTMNQALYQLYTQGIIDLDTALGRSAEPGELQSMIRAQVPVAQSGQRREM
ncbi:MAG: type IV pilus twitching motility protein PilT [Sandaracinaceae bacterium]|jgi:twitching motility protein PilT|nr:type IV pilus twitching motility protein PilT [Sandaracinaceae bacterium]MBK7153987.1 type IV pilus twitching motility protein PilT [Sandaracinaceae bacterium]MBK8408538.1 type IV pilus twitching motility protein PilT [Sandaracinaceae bacterium]MBK8590877.1 type IV pilus twitching motility protein PilT [Sandaracinaceae bacterium]MBP7685063.1 type IV pilus twitching motility protein PilT [Deltaproteobacteria bacterium]